MHMYARCIIHVHFIEQGYLSRSKGHFQGHTNISVPYVPSYLQICIACFKYAFFMTLNAWPWHICQETVLKMVIFTLGACIASFWGVTCNFDLLTLKGHLKVTVKVTSLKRSLLHSGHSELCFEGSYASLTFWPWKVTWRSRSQGHFQGHTNISAP